MRKGRPQKSEDTAILPASRATLKSCYACAFNMELSEGEGLYLPGYRKGTGPSLGPLDK